MAEIYEWRSPVQPRSGLARRFINGLSSSTLSLQALSVPLVHSRMWGDTKSSSSLGGGGLAEGGDVDTVLQGPLGSEPTAFSLSWLSLSPLGGEVASSAVRMVITASGLWAKLSIQALGQKLWTLCSFLICKIGTVTASPQSGVTIGPHVGLGPPLCAGV